MGLKVATVLAMIGAILVNINPAYRTHELAFALSRLADGARREVVGRGRHEERRGYSFYSGRDRHRLVPND